MDEKIIRLKDDQAVTPEMDLAKEFTNHFENIVESLHTEHPCKVDLDRDRQ